MLVIQVASRQEATTNGRSGPRPRMCISAWPAYPLTTTNTSAACGVDPRLLAGSPLQHPLFVLQPRGTLLGRDRLRGTGGGVIVLSPQVIICDHTGHGTA